MSATKSKKLLDDLTDHELDRESNHELNGELGFGSNAGSLAVSEVSLAKSRLSFEAALSELEQMVERIEQMPSSLDETIAAYERGMLLVNVCRQSLQEAENKLKIYEQQNNQFKAFELDSKLKSS